ncbi:hypothetical protein ABVT39_002329 [Epinephelus coioides]
MEKPTPQTQGSDGTSKMTPSMTDAQNSESRQVLEILRRQIDRLESERDEVIEMNEKKTFQLQALEADLKTAEDKIKDLQKQCQKNDTEKEELTNEIFDLNKRILDLLVERKCAVQALQKELSDSHDSVAALKKEQMTEDEIHAAVVKQLKDRHIIEVNDYKQQLASLEAKLQENKQDFASKLREERPEQTRLNDKLTELEDQNKELKNIISHQKDLTGELSDLRETVKDKDKIIQMMERDIAEYMKERRYVMRDWLTLREDKATAEASLKSLAETNAELQSKLTATQSEMAESKRWQTKAGAELLEVTEENKKAESQLAEQMNKVRALESTQQRFKADLEACRPAMSDFKSLKSKFVELCRRYLHNDSEVKMNSDLEDKFRDKLAAADAKISKYEKLYMKDYGESERYCELLYKNRMKTEAFAKQIKTLKSENISLRRDIDRTQRLLQKATKPVLQKVKSWINKKVLGRVPVAQEAAEEPPTLYQDYWQSSDLSDDDNISSVQPSVSESSTSSGPDSLDGVIHVKPYVAEDLPPVDM